MYITFTNFAGSAFGIYNTIKITKLEHAMEQQQENMLEMVHIVR